MGIAQRKSTIGIAARLWPDIRPDGQAVGSDGRAGYLEVRSVVPRQTSRIQSRTERAVGLSRSDGRGRTHAEAVGNLARSGRADLLRVRAPHGDRRLGVARRAEGVFRVVSSGDGVEGR